MAPIWGKQPSAERGREGEALAKQLIVRKGYRVIAENFLCREGEIDLIALHRKELVFIEVKTRRGDTFGSPAESITRAKLQKMQHAAAVFRQRTGLWKPFRFEAVCLTVEPKGKFRLEHLEEL